MFLFLTFVDVHVYFLTVFGLGASNVQPYYERVARLFNGPDAVHPGIVLMTRVDCALKVY